MNNLTNLIKFLANHLSNSFKHQTTLILNIKIEESPIKN
jgi:hypothetical protein